LVTIGSGVFGWLRVKVCIFPYTLKVVLTTLTLPCECDRKSYTGSRLAPNSMTLNDLERQNWWFYGFFWRFQAATQVFIIHKVAPCYYCYAIQIEDLVFIY